MSQVEEPTDRTRIGTDGDPIVLFRSWLEAAKKSESGDATAMSLATADQHGRPNVRMVLLKGVDDGFVFYTNVESAKGVELGARPQAALCFHWPIQQRQVRVRGSIAKVSDTEADAYFSTRPKDSQIGAWASAQSRPMGERWEFEKSIAKIAAKYALSKVPRPPFWSGYRVIPLEIEFWRDRPFRLHERILYHRADVGQPWTTARLYP